MELTMEEADLDRQTVRAQKRAILSIYEEDRIRDDRLVIFAKGLLDLGWQIISSGGTARFLAGHGLGVTDVTQITGIPPILKHCVVTLGHHVEGGLLADGTDSDLDEMVKYAIPWIDLAAVTLYPTWKVLALPNPTLEDVKKLIDIGGNAMLRAAAKGGRIAVSSPDQFMLVLDELRPTGEISEATRVKLAGDVFWLTAQVDAAIAKFYKAQSGELVDAIFMEHGKKLAYAENRDQNPAFMFSEISNVTDLLGIPNYEVIKGDPSYISTADLDTIQDILCLMVSACEESFEGNVPFICIAGKHGSPCGAAFDWKDPKIVIEKALLGDPIAVMGGEVICNFPITDELAKLLYSSKSYNIGRLRWGLDLVVAPKFLGNSMEILSKSEKRRLLANPQLETPFMAMSEWSYRPVRGGWLKQRAPNFVFSKQMADRLTTNELSAPFIENAIIAFACAWRAYSNTCAIANNNMLIGLGCGQQDRIACTQLAIQKAQRSKHSLQGAVFAEDGFIPYATSEQGKPKEPGELLAEAGCMGGVVPADGNHLEEVFTYFQERGMMVTFVDKTHRGFSRH